ncbi:MAG: MarR family transcriptional regulator [Ardenticatenales bacterium]|nr:MarR family transcriptional regulator [Ardenticatenales bacterium]
MSTKYEGSEQEHRALDLYIKLMRAADAVNARVNNHLSTATLSVSQFGALETLYHLGPLEQGEIGAKILRSSGNLSLVIDSLATRGLVVRQRDPEDRRRIIIHLTEAGRQVIDNLFPPHVANIVQEMAVLSPEEQEQMAALCRRVGRQDTGK